MGELIVKDFSAGWCPSDDYIGGRPNGLLQMDSVELDQNGALALTNGTIVWNPSVSYTARAHTFFAKFIAGARSHYTALADGTVHRDVNLVDKVIATNGSVLRAAFMAAYNYVFCCSGTQRIRDDGTNIVNLGLSIPGNQPTAVSGGAGTNLIGTYQWAQMDVFNSGTGMIDKSPLSALSASVVLAAAGSALITPNAPQTGANEVWIYRRGGNLDTWYRVSRITSAYTTQFNDNLSDLDAIALSEIANLFLTPVNTTGIAEDILAIVGLVYGRTVYISSKYIYFSMINSPGVYDSRTTIPYGSSQNTGSETFLFARKLGENTIVIGTTVDLYILTGTFTSLSDGTLDIYLHPMSVPEPPISIDVCVYNGFLIYMCALGWKQISVEGTTTPLCPPRTDILYRGDTRYGYGGVPTYVYPAPDASGNVVRYPCCVAKNKLWVAVPSIVNKNLNNAFVYRMEVYDFTRQYWRTMQLAPSLLASEDDEAVSGVFTDSGGTNIRQIDAPVVGSNTVKQFNGTNQTVNILTPVFDNGEPHNRKDCFTLKLRINTGNTNITLNIYTDLNTTSPTYIVTINTNGLTDLALDISTIIRQCKTFQFNFTGTPAEFILEDIKIDYNSRPLQLTSVYSIPDNLGTASRKRMPGFSIEIDTLGNTFQFYPILDGITQLPLSLSAAEKTTFLYLFTQDQILRDFNYKILPAVVSTSGAPGSGISVIDNFNRSDSVGLGSNWSNLGMDIQIQSNKLRIAGTSFGVAPYLNFGATKNYRVGLTYKSWSVGSFWEYGVASYITGVAYNNRSNYGLSIGRVFSSLNNGYELHIFRTNWNGGVPTTTYFTRVGYNPTPGDVIELDTATSADGSAITLTAYVNGIQLAQYIDTDLIYRLQFGAPGIVAETIDGTSIVLFDDWYAQTLDYALPIAATTPSYLLFELYGVKPSSKMEVLPEQTQFFRVPTTNFGSPRKKRVRTWPFIIDCLAGDVIVTPYVDDVAQPSIVVSGDKQTQYYFFGTDVFGTDYYMTFESNSPFELYDVSMPDSVQMLPIPKRFDQVGPQELFRIAKLTKMQFRLLAFGGTDIPYIVYFEDSSQQNGHLTVTDGKECIVEVPVAKSVLGSVLRIELGPTNFNFHRFATRVRADFAGQDTDQNWIDIEPIDG